jgi:hypothetical protein
LKRERERERKKEKKREQTEREKKKFITKVSDTWTRLSLLRENSFLRKGGE